VFIYSGERPGVWLRRGKRDALADISKDVGCPDVSPSYLTCPLTICLEDLPGPIRINIRAKLRQQLRAQRGFASGRQTRVVPKREEALDNTGALGCGGVCWVGEQGRYTRHSVPSS
jgi:hypothetical protein